MVISSNLQMKKPRPQEIKKSAQSDVATEQPIRKRLGQGTGVGQGVSVPKSEPGFG